MAYTIGELAKITRVTVRTLHHYDELGLVSPSRRTAAGYRLYEDRDVARLRQVLFFRELGFPLDEIAAVLDDPDFDQAAALREQRQHLLARRQEVDDQIAAVDVALDRLERGTPMNPDEIKALFDGFDPVEHEDEARDRWGGSAEFKESMRRTRRYGKAEWDEIRRASGDNYRALATLMKAGAAPADPAVQAEVEAHRAHITRWFYPCSREIHRALGEMYVADPRFTANIDRFAPGLARFLRDAIQAAPTDAD
jgi:DNA-binding transcriptional MerR regulator